MKPLKDTVRLQWLGARFPEQRVNCERELLGLLREAESVGDQSSAAGALVYISACLAWVGDAQFIEYLERLLSVHQSAETMFFAAALLESAGQLGEATRHRLAAMSIGLSDEAKEWGDIHVQLSPGQRLAPDYPHLRKPPRLDPRGAWRAAQMEAYIEATKRWKAHQ